MYRYCSCRVILSLAVVGTATLVPIPCVAELLTFEFNGRVAEDPFDESGAFPLINAGDAINGTFQYDSETPDDQFEGHYVPEPPFTVLSFEIEGTTFESHPSVPTSIDVLSDVDDPDFGPSDLFFIYSDFGRASGDFQGAIVEIGMALITSDLTVLSDLSLPEQFDAQRWDEKIVFLFGASETGGIVDIVGEIDTISRIVDGPALQAGDADQDLDFDQLDLVRVQSEAKYLTGMDATWGQGDWDAAPGGSPGNPPPGDGVFSQADIVAALSSGVYLTGSYAAESTDADSPRLQSSAVVGYDAHTGEVWVDVPVDQELTSINIDSRSGIFTGADANNVQGSFDNDSDENLFKATVGGSFGSFSFGSVAAPGLDRQLVLEDLSITGSLEGGGQLREVQVDFVSVPEPSTLWLVFFASMWFVARSLIFNRRSRV